MCGVIVQEAAWAVVDDCIQLYGGMGFMTVRALHTPVQSDMSIML